MSRLNSAGCRSSGSPLDAVHAEGATMADQPGSTCPLNSHPAVPAAQGSAAWLR
ncbi:hypothetical protein [Streptomyces lydicus]|uniref:hypothetical protein n=1 Tax=Streptomyces lydicus TaxID=47763 RepID=UPI003722FC83